MLKHLEQAIAAFAQMAVICTFGLCFTIGVAGVSRTKIPLACNDCQAPTTIVAAATRRV